MFRQVDKHRWLLACSLLSLGIFIVACQQSECPQCQNPEIVELPVTVVVTATPAANLPNPTLTHTASSVAAADTLPSPTPTPGETITNTATPFTPPPSQPYTPGPNAFIETFDGEPDQPTMWRSPNWDVTIHSRDWDTWFDPVPMEADHGPGCEGPPTTHPVTNYGGSVFNCRNHMMTAINGPGYAMIYLTPNHMVNFAERTAIIRWDMSTFRKSTRDWVDVWITPYDRNNQLTLLSWLPDLNGPAQDAVHVEMQDIVNTFNVGIIRDFEDTRLRGPVSRHGYDRFLEPDQARRDVFEIQLSTNYIRVGMPEYDFWWIDEPIDPPLDWTTGVVQFGHHSYTPAKGCEDGEGCGPTTWHWDNIIIDPAEPFTIIQADKTYLKDPEGESITFAEPAPADSHLRFSGFSETIEVSYNNGQSWQPAQRQAQFEDHNDRFQSYWMPIPAGTQQVHFRGTDRWAGGWLLRDLSIWSTTVTTVEREIERARARFDFSTIEPASRFCALPVKEDDS